MRHAVLAAVLTLAAAPAGAADHPCAADARARAAALLRFHAEVDVSGQVGVRDGVEQRAPVRALVGKGKLDALEVWGDVLKASYRMRFLYSRREGCALIGQEIVESVAP